MKIYPTQAGFTLLEVLVAVGIAFLIGLGVTTMFVDTFRLNRSISENLDINGEARRAIKIIVAETRTASPSSLGAYPIDQVGTSSLIFYSDIDSDPHKERIRYFLQNTTLKRGVTDPSGSPLVYNTATEKITEMVHDIQNSSTSPLFSYYDDTYTGSESALVAPISVSVVRLVGVNMIVRRDAEASSTSRVYTTQVSLRNLKDNL
jgi:prepilin-type N-terminal cleavage/methylation domain-containing protein